MQSEGLKVGGENFEKLSKEFKYRKDPILVFTSFVAARLPQFSLL